MRRPTPPAPQRRWTPCTEESAGRPCPVPGARFDHVEPTGGCRACTLHPLIPIHLVVIELGPRTIHWTCTACGWPNASRYTVLADHHVHAVIRSGADVLRADTEARLTALLLTERVNR